MQQARFAAEQAVLALFAGAGDGGGGGEEESSALHAVKMLPILALLTTAIIVISFRHPRDRTKTILTVEPNPDEIAESVLPDAQRAFSRLMDSELSDEQKAVLWATWMFSRTADEIAAFVNSAEGGNPFGEAVLKKIWISRSDARVRPLHLKLHGRAVPVSEDFWRWPHTGQRLRWPGDIDAPLDATMGCRCVCLLSWASEDSISERIKRVIETSRPS